MLDVILITLLLNLTPKLNKESLLIIKYNRLYGNI